MWVPQWVYIDTASLEYDTRSFNLGSPPTELVIFSPAGVCVIYS